MAGFLNDLGTSRARGTECLPVCVESSANLMSVLKVSSQILKGLSPSSLSTHSSLIIFPLYKEEHLHLQDLLFNAKA